MLELAVKLRQKTGKNNKRLRKRGFIPAVLYGHKEPNLLLTVNYQDFEKLYQETGGSALINLKINDASIKGVQEKIVLIYDTAKDPVTDKFIHADFYQVKMDEVLKIEVPLEFVGQSQVVTEQSGVLIKSIQQIEIEALPRNLPRVIKVDISSIKTFNDNIYIKDLELPAGVKTNLNPKEVVASVIPPRKEAELEELEKAPEEKIDEVKVVGEEKKEAETEEEEGENQKERKKS